MAKKNGNGNGGIPLREYVERHWADHDRTHETLDDRASRTDQSMRDLQHIVDGLPGIYLTRNSYDIAHQALIERVQKLETEKANMEGKLWVVGLLMSGGATLASILLNIIIRLVFH